MKGFRRTITASKYQGKGKHLLTLQCGHQEMRSAAPGWHPVGFMVLCHSCAGLPPTVLVTLSQAITDVKNLVSELRAHIQLTECPLESDDESIIQDIERRYGLRPLQSANAGNSQAVTDSPERRNGETTVSNYVKLELGQSQTVALRHPTPKEREREQSQPVETAEKSAKTKEEKHS